MRFDPGTPGETRAEVRRRNNLQKIEDLPLRGLERVRLTDRGNVPDRARQLQMEAAVVYAVPNYYRYLDAVTPNDPSFGKLWALHNTGQTGGTSDADIDAPEGWDAAMSAKDVVVGVIDTGIQVRHPDLKDNMWTNPGESGVDALGRDKRTNGVDDDLNGYIDDVHGWDFVNEDNSLYDRSDVDYHGTHVAGTIAAARGNSLDVTGVSDAKIMSLKIFSVPVFGALDSDIIEAIAYSIRMGADLTNNSWGGGELTFNPAVQEMIELANDAGQLFVAASGNSWADNDSSPHYPASYPNANIVSVTATDDTDARIPWANYGSNSVDLGAPGGHYWGFWAPGRQILSTWPGRNGKAILVGPETDPNVPYRSALHTFGLEGMPDAADRTALMSASLKWSGISQTSPILLVDDDLGSGYETVYQSTLASLGYKNVSTHGVSYCDQGPGANEMDDYALVIWFTGWDYSCTLTDADQAELTTYLLGGGKALAFGQDIGYDITENGLVPNPLFDQIFRARYAGDFDLDFAPKGVAGTPYAQVPVAELDTSQSYSSAVEARAGAIVAMRGTTGEFELSGTSMAAPHVSGVLAMILAADPGISHLDAKALVMNSGDAVPSLSGTTVSGKRVNLASALSRPAVGTFALSVNPSRLTLSPGQSGSFTVEVAAIDGFSGSVSLTVEGLPNGASGSFSPNPVAAGNSSILTISTTRDAKVGKYPLTITGSSGGQLKFASATLQIGRTAGGKKS